MTRRRAVALVCAALALGGCSRGDPRITHYVPDRPQADFVTVGYAAADRLAARLPQRPDAPALLVASLASVDDLGTSSTFGRMMAEIVASRLVQAGHAVREVKLRGTVLVRRAGGEFVLSRDSAEIAGTHDVGIVVTGTYARAGGAVVVNLRAVRAADARVVASVDFTMPGGMSALAEGPAASIPTARPW